MILINSVPRSGTNLLKYFITNVLRADNQPAFYIPHMLESGWRTRLGALKARESDGIYWMHCPHTPAVANWCLENATNFYVYRHPGAVAVSWTRWILSSEQNPFYPTFAGLEFDDALMLMINGNGGDFDEGHWPGLASIYHSFDGWLEHDNVHLFAYEDLVNDGNHVAMRIAQHFNVDANEYELAAAASLALNRRGYTYRNGTVDSWRNEVQAQHVEALEREGLMDYGG